MRINAVTNNNFTGRTKALSRLARKAEKRLAKRLTDPDSLMIDTDGVYRVFSTGRKFTGKYRIGTKDLEQFFHVKNGELYFTLIRGLDGSKKIGGFGIGRDKRWTGPATYEDSVMIAGLSEMKSRIDAGMMQNYGIKKCIENGTSTHICSCVDINPF